MEIGQSLVDTSPNLGVVSAISATKKVILQGNALRQLAVMTEGEEEEMVDINAEMTILVVNGAEEMLMTVEELVVMREDDHRVITDEELVYT